jgi:copper(I)-binding protein
MLIDLAAPLKEGETFPLSLTFEHAGTVEVTVTVKGVGAMGGAGMSHDHDATN